MPAGVRRLTPLDAVGLGVVGLWCAWVVASTVLAGRPPALALPYTVPALVAVAGVALGRWTAAHATRWWVPAAILGIALLFALGWLVTPTPGKLPTRYANANAAVGVQLVALSCLAWLGRRHRPQRLDVTPDPPAERSDVTPARRASPLRRLAAWLAPAALLASLLVVAVNASRAASVVAVPVLLLCLLAVALRGGPWRWLTVTAGAAAMAAAAYAQVTLARQSTWPDAVVAALSRVRKQLWSEALGLWSRHRVTGGGAGSFREINKLSQDPDLAAAHSSVLQVGSEFGFVGLAIFAAFLLVGLLLASRGDRATALIATSAWAGLAVHSTIDHLYEFVAVSLTAALVLGWAGSSAHAVTRSVAGDADPSEGGSG